MKFLQTVQNKLMLLEQDAPPADAAMPADPNAAAAAPAPATPSEVDQIGADANQKIQEFAADVTIMMKDLLNVFFTKFRDQLAAEDTSMQAFAAQMGRLKSALDAAGKDVSQLNSVESVIGDMKNT